MSGGTVTDLTRGIYRRLYAGFIKGRRINRISLQAEAWFWRVLASADDFGNADADPGLIYAATVGNRKGVSIKDVTKWIEELRESGLIQMYASESGDKYLHIQGFEEMQPAGKNGRRVKRFPSFCESGGIQGNPVPSVLPHSYSDTHSDTDPHEADSPLPFHGQEFLSAFAAMEQHRKEKRAKLTPTARRQLCAELAAMGEERATAAIVYSVGKGWTGVFEENGTNGRRRTQAEMNAAGDTVVL